ncbi:hypothetical protein F5Y17DRAFT_174160 [Xylariaceae sp. FL0594]|nr:hypothetical protein F5Y17DRAFT_174160 [Xylariaceae sp. FL0594]
MLMMLSLLALSPLPSNLALKDPRVFIPGVALCHLLLVRALRYRRRDAMIKDFKRRHGSYDRDALSEMSVDEAWAILKQLTEQEFPSIFLLSVFFALFKTYGIPSISRLLAATGQLAADNTASKRAADTGMLIAEFLLNPPDSGRKYEAIARTNYLHERYRKAGKITDPDLLYTLSLFALEPVRWANRHDWRQFTDLERTAMGVFWRDVGEAMEIPYDLLEPYMGEHGDGLDWLEAIDQWSLTYEESYMVPADSNEKLAWGTLNVLMYNTPYRMRGFTLGIASALMDERLRVAMRIENPSLVQEGVVRTFLTLRAWMVRYLHLPRPWWLRKKLFADEADPKTGKYSACMYVAHPWYVKPTFWSRWNPEALRTRFLWRGHLPGDDTYHPEGYAIEELGPDYQKGRGQEEMERIKAQLMQRRKAQLEGGCPMSMFHNVR